MNKLRMGKFLKELRTLKKYTLTDLSNIFEEKAYLIVSTNAISKWEKGESIPDIDKLNFLSELYGVSIDELLDGEKLKRESFEEKYYFNNAELIEKHVHNDGLSIFDVAFNQRKLIRTSFKSLAIKYLSNNYNKIDRLELMYLFSNYFNCSNGLSEREFNTNIKRIKDDLTLTINEKWWEVQKLLSPVNGIAASFGMICDEDYLLPRFDELMSLLEDWEKDMLLATIQIHNPVYINYDNSSKQLDYYKDKAGKEFNEEQITKDTIKYLIKNGAVLNSKYMGYSGGRPTEVRTIDEIEKLYDLVKKPIEIPVFNNDKCEYYYIENTPRNRLFIKYRYSIINPLKELGYSYDDIYQIVSSNVKVPEEVVLKFAEKKGLNLNRDIKYIKADLYYDLSYLNSQWSEYYLSENGHLVKPEYELNDLIEFLNNGDTKLYQIKLEYTGGKTPHERFEYVRDINNKMTLSNFIKDRQKNMTEQLMDEIDSLSLDEIRNGYFMGH